MTDETAATESTDSTGEPETTHDTQPDEANEASETDEAPISITAPPRPFDDEAAEQPEADLDATEDADDTPADPDTLPEPEVIAEDAEPETPAAFEDLDELPALLEALLFVADHPIDVSYIARAVEVSGTRVERALDLLADRLRDDRRGIRLQRGPQGVQLVSAPEAAQHVERFLGLEANRRLSTAALETLAIIAYRQPITRGQVDAIRGVSSDGAVATLRARDLIESAGHAVGPGRPMLFRTTQRFLEHFGLERPGQLPALPDDVDLPPAEIGQQLGLDEAEVIEALKPRIEETEEPPKDAPEGEATPTDASDTDDETPADEAALPDGDTAESEDDDMPDDLAEALASVTPVAPDIELPSDVQALTEAAEQAFEASRERLAATTPVQPAVLPELGDAAADDSEDEQGTQDDEA